MKIYELIQIGPSAETATDETCKNFVQIRDFRKEDDAIKALAERARKWHEFIKENPFVVCDYIEKEYYFELWSKSKPIYTRMFVREIDTDSLD